MVETTTKNYGWVKPEIAGSPSSWGGFLNNDLDAIDALVFTNQQAAVPIGVISMFGGTSAPTNWVLCDGSVYPTTAPYDKLFAVIGYTYGGGGASFAVPSFLGSMPLGADPPDGLPVGETGGSYEYALDVAHLPAHAHPITDVAHNHGVNQWAHSHAIATGGHSHNVLAHAHGASLVRQGAGSATLGSGGPIQIASFGNTDAAASTTDAAGNLGGGTDTQTSGVSLNASGTGLSATQNVGGGATMEIIPVFLAIQFIIRYQ